MDIEGQSERINMSEKIAPVVLDRDGNSKSASPEIRRRAREIVEKSGANSAERFNRIVVGETNFRDQAKNYVTWAVNRDREPLEKCGQHSGRAKQVDSPGHRRHAATNGQQHHCKAASGIDEEVAFRSDGE